MAISVNVADSPKVTVDLIDAVGIEERPSFWIGRERLTREALLDRLRDLRDKSSAIQVAIRHTASMGKMEVTSLRQSLVKSNIQDVSIGKGDLPHVFAYANAKHDGTIRGRVVDAHPTVASPKYHVMLWHKSWESMSGVNPSLVVGVGEAFEFRNVGPGDYEIHAREWRPNNRVVHFDANWTYVQAKAAVEDGKVAEVRVVFGKGDTGRWNDAYTWGEAVDGVIMRVTRAKFTIAPGEQIDLHVDIHNGGKIDRKIVMNHESWGLEIDGQWLKQNGGASSGRAISLLKSKQAQRNVDVWAWLGENMTSTIEGLPPGKHTLRVAGLLNGEGRAPNDPPQIRIVSQPVEIVVKDEGEVAEGNTEDATADLPDGVYRIRPSESKEKGVEFAWSDTDGRVVLLERLTEHFGTGTMTSTANDNTRFRIDLAAAGPFPQGDRSGHFALVVDGLCVMAWSNSDPDKNHRMDLSVSVVGKEASARIARTLRIAPRLRQHPGHKMDVRFSPTKPAFRPGEPVVLQMEIKNVGDQLFSFVDGGRQRGPRNNQFGFTACRRGGEGPEVPDTGDPTNFGGLGAFITLKPGEMFEKNVDITKWFDLSTPDTYKIDGRFEMEINAGAGGGYPIDWEDIAQGTAVVVVLDAEEAWGGEQDRAGGGFGDERAELPSKTTVRGTVVDDQTGEPVSHIITQGGRFDPAAPADVTWGYTETRSSRKDGEFTAAVRWPEGWTARILADGYIPQPVLTEAPVAGQDAIEVVVRLKRGKLVKGRVLDHKGKPVKGVAVFAIGPTGLNLAGGKAWDHEEEDTRTGLSIPMTRGARTARRRGDKAGRFVPRPRCVADGNSGGRGGGRSTSSGGDGQRRV